MARFTFLIYEYILSLTIGGRAYGCFKLEGDAHLSRVNISIASRLHLRNFFVEYMNPRLSTLKVSAEL
jgi:hypothetical protein